MPATHPAAATAAHSPATATDRKFLSFRLGAEEYGIDILGVQEIRGYTVPTHIANAPGEMLGVLNLRGTIVPVVDMRLQLGLPSPRYDDVTVTIVLTLRDRLTAIVVDSVSDVVELGPAQIRPAPPMAERTQATHIVGIGTVQQGDSERMLILLDMQAMLGATEPAQA